MSRVVYKGHDVKNAEICNTFFLEVKYYTDTIPWEEKTFER